MLKVIIADDEERVCRLIMKLVAWEEVDMEVLAAAHNGIEALELIEKHQPDLIITDIRMPGYDGLELIEKAKELKKDLEFIIISGYGQFEYAQKAIKFGVSDYLLKPIQKTELTDTLLKLGDKIRNNKDRIASSDLKEMRIRSENERRRIQFMQALMAGDTPEEMSGTELFSDQSGFNMDNRCSQILVMKTDFKGSTSTEEKEILEDTITIVLDEAFKGYNLIDHEIYQEDQYTILLLQFPEEKKEEYLKREKDLIELFKKSIPEYQNRTVTLGLGHITDNLGGILHSFESAMLALEESYIGGAGKVYYREQLESGEFLRRDIVHEFFLSFEKHVSMLDLEGTRRLLRDLKDRIREEEKVTGHEVIHLAKEICNLYSFTMLKNKFSLAESSILMDRFEAGIKHVQSLEEIFIALENKILQSMTEVIINKKEMLSGPIREAKKYMEDHYMNNLSLDEVSQKVGFSSNYFSALFKKETGVTFIEHLSEIRMNSAKELLKEKDLRIADICEMVGYTDVKYFTRSFIRRTGLKPNEYRKIYA
ncbi:response regulator [Proteiniclasticum sp.]|uniref:response regulator transcription factor n=1 Tax=Proteiniclasticum sp. TaxID=2053595 RepID=UPI002896ED09|nr:response regulator [Proteiniclasticum sp.]